MTTTYMTVEREDAGGVSRKISLIVTGTCNDYVEARTHGDPDDCSPAEGGDIEIESVKVFIKRGASPNPHAHLFTELTEEEDELAKESLQTAHENEVEAAMEARADAIQDDRDQQDYMDDEY